MIACFVAAAPGLAQADNEPWKQGVTPEQMAQAKKLLDEGNVFLLEHDYEPALEKYKQAVAVWDHPAIRFNMVRCLIQLGRTVEASDNLERALKYGAAPLEETVYNEALAYQKLLANQIADVTVSCAQEGAELTLDGQPLLHCPGKITQRVVPGRHQVVGKKAGFLTRTSDLFVTGGHPEEVTIALEPFVARAASITHRWKPWIPWTVFAAGFAVAGVGGLLELSATSTRDEWEQRIQHDCASTPCPADYLDSLRSRAIAENRGAIVGFSVGAAAVATGAVMLYR